MPNPQAIYASDLTMYNCPRALYNCAVNRHMRPKLDEETIRRLNHYAALETVAFGELKKLGWNIINPDEWTPGVTVPKDKQELFIYKDKDNNDTMRGRIDLVACPPGIEQGGLYEVKTAGEYIFKQINKIDDFIDTDKWWIPGQLAQWGMYMYMSGKNYGGIVQLNRDSLMLKDGGFDAEIKIHHCSILEDHKYYNERIDEFITDLVVGNIEEAWAGALTGIEPDFCQNLATCSHCWCRGICCFPPVEHEGVEIGFIGHASSEQVTRMEELRPLVKEFNGLKKLIEDPLKLSIDEHGYPPQGFIIGDGDYLAQAKVTLSPKFAVPKEVKEKYRIADGTRKAIKIIKL